MIIAAGTVAAGVAALNLVLTIGGGVFFAGKLTGKIQRIETDVKETKGLLITSAVEADRLRRAEDDIQNVEEDIRNLRKGVGYINDADARGINREY
jgi:hypothetical protein